MTKKYSFLILYSHGSISGYGHYKRSLILEKYIKKHLSKNIKKVSLNDKYVTNKNITDIITKKTISIKPDILVLDLNYRYTKSEIKFKKMFKDLKKQNLKIIGIDTLRRFYKVLDYVWIPSPYKNKDIKSNNIIYGWDKMIFNRNRVVYKKKETILFLIGAAKNKFISKNLPKLAENSIPRKYKLLWVSGKFSEKPIFQNHKRWTIHKNIEKLDKLFGKVGYTFALYGTSMFESLNSGIPTVSYCSKNNYSKDKDEIEFLRKKKICFIETNLLKSMKKLNTLLVSNKLSRSFSKKSIKYLKNYDYSFLKDL